MMKHTNGAAVQWIRKPEALAILGVSERSLDRMVNAGKIEKQLFPRPRRTPEPMYRTSDIDKLTARQGILLEDSPGGIGGGSPVRTAAAPAQQQFPALLTPGALAPLFAAIEFARSVPPRQQPQWLDLEAAAAATGLSKKFLRSLIRAGTLPAFKDGRNWKCSREDLSRIRPPLQLNSANSATPGAVAQTRGKKGK
jgi:excisionase family DNA binding protein